VIPIIDQPHPDNGLYVAAGFSGHGFALGPSIGKQLAEWIADGRTSLDLKPFRLSRFAEGDVNRAKQAL
jgi:glycine/D-amino acid oxidase-like deaminating enzyme